MLDPRWLYVFNRLLKKDCSLKFSQEAAQIAELTPARKGHRPAAIMLPGQIDRARATTPSTTMEIQRAIALGGEIQYPATTLYSLPNATIDQTSLYLAGRRKSFTGLGLAGEFKRSFRKPRHVIPRALLTSTHQGLTYFGDWLFENNSRILLARELGETPFSMCRTPHYGHGARYQDIFGVACVQFERAHVKELLIVDDWGHPPEKAARYRLMRERARALAGRQRGHDVFVVRGQSGQMRFLKNEAACIEWARQRGFAIVDPARMTVDELVYELRDARCVVGVEGSGLLHGLVSMASDGFMLGIVAADRFVVSSKEYADAIGIPVAFVVADKGDVSGFEVDLQELDATYELALSTR